MLPITAILDSVGKVRVLSYLAKKGEMNVTAIAKNTKMNHSRLNTIIEELENQNIVYEKTFGRIKIYGINLQDDAGRTLYKFLSSWHREVIQNNRREEE